MWKKTGAVYDGDWKDNMRHGFGMYSIKQGDAYVKQYAGGWKEDMRDVSCITCMLNVASLHSTAYNIMYILHLVKLYISLPHPVHKTSLCMYLRPACSLKVLHTSHIASSAIYFNKSVQML